MVKMVFTIRDTGDDLRCEGQIEGVGTKTEMQMAKFLSLYGEMVTDRVFEAAGNLGHVIARIQQDIQCLNEFEGTALALRIRSEEFKGKPSPEPDMEMRACIDPQPVMKPKAVKGGKKAKKG